MSIYELKSSLIFGPVQTDRQTKSDAYEPTVQIAQVGSINCKITSDIVEFDVRPQMDPVCWTIGWTHKTYRQD